METRDAVDDDIVATLAIFNAVIVSSTAVYMDSPATRAERASWWRGRVGPGYSV